MDRYDIGRYGMCIISTISLVYFTRLQMPPIDSICRVTAYRQHRDTKHQWRAVLVTPKGKDGKLIYDHPNPTIDDRSSSQNSFGRSNAITTTVIADRSFIFSLFIVEIADFRT